VFSSSEIKDLLESQLPDCEAVVVDDRNDGRHFTAQIASSAFAGKPLVQQHQLVYKALGEHMKRDIHALAIHTFTPDRWPFREV